MDSKKASNGSITKLEKDQEIPLDVKESWVERRPPRYANDGMA
nr:hypothetical protein [Bacillus fonticola]